MNSRNEEINHRHPHDTVNDHNVSFFDYVNIGQTDDENGLRVVRVFRTELEATEHTQTRTWIEHAVDLLQCQWPRGDSQDEYYQQKVIHESSNGGLEYYGLPCSYLLLKNDECVGHGRLTECFESAGGNAAAVTFIVIDSTVRGQGLGRHLMKYLEEEAKRLGYHYIYLWTKTAIVFYQKIGYQECQRVSLKRACLAALDTGQVESLEALLFRKCQQQHGGKTTAKPRETILLPPSGDSQDQNVQDIWLRKRLVEHVGSVHVSQAERLEELKEFLTTQSGQFAEWHYFLLSLPWHAQVGPSCGLAALRMVREYYFLQSSNVDDDNVENGDSHIQFPSLLGEAQERGYSKDGELFNANHLLDLADTICGLNCEMWSTKDLQPQQVWDILRSDGVFIVPYDSNARTRLPACLGGRSAHYGIIVGILVGYSNEQRGLSHQKLEFYTLEQADGTLLDHTNNDSLYLMIQHSLSLKFSIAKWSDFIRSNQQLITVDSDKYGAADLDLKDRIILVRGIRSNVI